jgi:hypothetical protein
MRHGKKSLGKRLTDRIDGVNVKMVGVQKVLDTLAIADLNFPAASFQPVPARAPRSSWQNTPNACRHC